MLLNSNLGLLNLLRRPKLLLSCLKELIYFLDQRETYCQFLMTVMKLGYQNRSTSAAETASQI